MKAPLPFARTFSPTCKAEHRFEKEWNELPYCARCGGMEAGLMEYCPIQRLTVEELDLVYMIYCQENTFAQLTTIAQYNEVAKRYNDELLDSTMRNVSMTGQHSQ